MASRRKNVRGAEENWNFLTFPVLVAFILGIAIASLLSLIDLGFAVVLWYVGLLGISFSFAHFLTRQFSRRRRDRAREREEEEERERRALAARARAGAADEGDGARRRRRRRRAS
jgi:hypothetical protein